MTSSMQTAFKPRTLLLMDPQDVPDLLRPRVDAIVVPTWNPEGLADATERLEALEDIEVLVTANADLSAAALDRFSGLRLVVATGTAYDYIDIEHCRARGITVCNTPGYTGSSVAEHAITLALSSNRYVCALDTAIRCGQPETSRYVANELRGKTAGIVGLGDIGGRIARLALGLDMRALFCNRSPRALPGATQVGLEDLLSKAHFVFLSLPLTPQTFHLLSFKAFAAMRPDTIVINISADEIIDPDALAEALEARRIAGAALDVIGSPEPYMDLPNVVMTPSHGWYTVEGVRRRAETWIGTVEAYLSGKPRHVVSQPMTE